MATVFIPSLLQELTGGKERVEVHGETVRQIVNNLDEMHPGIKGRLVDGYKIKPNISVAIDGEGLGSGYAGQGRREQRGALHPRHRRRGWSAYFGR